MKRKSRRKGFDPLRVFSGPMFEQRMTSAELALAPGLKRDAADLAGLGDAVIRDLGPVAGQPATAEAKATP